MSTSAPPSIAPGTQGMSLLETYQAIYAYLKRYNVERDEEIDLLLLAMISGVDLLLLGEPGVGKTWAIELLVNHCITGADLFTHLCAKDQSVGEILGERDIQALSQGQTGRIMTGMLPEANFAYMDEVFKSSPPMLNPLLDIFAKRELKIGGNTIDCSQLISIFMSSNELPDREDLMAFRDRIAITKFVEGVKSPEGRRQITDMQLAVDVQGIDTTGLQPLTLDEIKAIRAEVKLIDVPDGIRDIMGEIEQQCFEAKHAISQRRKRDIWRVVKSKAWARGGDTVRSDDFLIAEHMLWNLPSDQESSRNIVLKHANQFVRRAQGVKQALEPIMAKMDNLKVEIGAASGDREKQRNLMSSGFPFLRELQDLADQAKDYIRQGEHEGQDVTDLKDSLSEVQKALKWTSKQLTGVDDDDDED